MRIYDNGIYRDMTEEEIKEWEEQQKEIIYEPTFEEKIEAQVVYTAMMTDTLLEVE